MNNCPLIETCVFFNDRMQNMPASAEMMKDNFCRDNYTSRARHTVFSAVGREKVTTDLFPRDASYAEKIIAAA